MAVSALTPPAVSTPYLLSELICSRSWQRHAIAEATETDLNDIARWTETDLNALQLDQRRAVETLLSVSTTVPYWERGHA
jgi:hypothetical protein